MAFAINTNVASLQAQNYLRITGDFQSKTINRVTSGLRIVASGDELTVRISDEGGERPIPISEAPDIEAKLRGEQKPRGWGLFLIQNMVDAMRVTTHDGRHTVELVVRRQPTTAEQPTAQERTAQEGTSNE